MRILVISDIHANISALEVVLEDAGSVDATWCLGDLIGYGPDPNECIERIRGLSNLVCLLGNHDAAALGQIDLENFNREARISAEWMKTTISPNNFEFLKNLPEKLILNNITLAHGSPRNPVWEYLLDDYTALANFKYFDTKLCFVGHTHLQIAYLASRDQKTVELKWMQAAVDLTLNQRAILNPGSVGQPRDHDPRAAYAIFDTDKESWLPCRVAYDYESVQRRIFKAGLPHRHALRLAQGW